MSRVMKWNPPPNIFGVSRFQRDHIKTLLVEVFDQTRLVLIDYDQVRIEAE
jgi:hypothetical protein